MADSPYPELKKTHTAAHNGTPWRDYKPPPPATVWAIIQGLPNYWILVAAIDLGVFDALAAAGPTAAAQLGADLDCSAAHLESSLDALVVLGVVDVLAGIGTDGNNASNYSDMMRATYLVAGLFKDARTDPQMFPAEMAYEMATLGGARALRLEDQVGSLEPGKVADIVLHDTDRPEWRPLLNVVNQLVWSADGRGVHTVFVDGSPMVENDRCVTLDEERLLATAQRMGESITARSGLPDKAKWPVL